MPCQNIKGVSSHLIDVPVFGEEEHLPILLPECVDFIHAAVEAGGRVLVQSGIVSRIRIVICAYCKPYLFFHLSL